MVEKDYVKKNTKGCDIDWYPGTCSWNSPFLVPNDPTDADTSRTEYTSDPYFVLAPFERPKFSINWNIPSQRATAVVLLTPVHRPSVTSCFH
jgi:hypothetical protein